MKKRKNIITVAIDSPAAAGGGTQAKLIAKQYNLLHLDTGRIYRMIGKIKLDNPKKLVSIGFNKALSSINKGNPWNNFLFLKTFLSTNDK